MDPYFLTGFSDAESSFSVSIRNKSNSKGDVKWMVEPEFQIGLSYKDEELLRTIKASFEYYSGCPGKVGRIQVSKNKSFFRVSALSELIKIIEDFDSYPLLTKKRKDYLIWREVVLRMQRGEHQTYVGVRDIVKLKSALNLGLTDKLRKEFDITSEEEKAAALYKGELGNEQLSINAQWIVGFTSGEGNFMIGLRKEGKLGKIPQLRFQLTQHSRDEELFRRLALYFGCGKVYVRNSNGRQAVEFTVQNFSEIIEIIIPLLRDNPIMGIKALDFADWCAAGEIMKVKGHLTQEGLDQICKLKALMNQERSVDISTSTVED